MKHLLKKLLLALGLAAFCATPFAVFDPVNDDTDLFRNNPNIPSQRPNVLIILDNTANWSSGGKFTAEQSALVTLINGDGVAGSGNTTGLDDSFNVGLMIFGQTGSACQFSTLTGTPVPDGAYVRYGIRQMTPGNKAVLSSIITSFTDAACAQNGDQGNSANGAQALHEAYLYYGGKPARHGISQIKRDYAGSDSNHPYSHQTRTSALPPYPLASQTATTYTSPITADCMKNYIIYISNGKTDSSDNSPSAALFSGSTGLSPNAVAFGPLSPSGYEDSWMDEYASFMANTGVDFTNASSVTAKQTIFTYVVDVVPGTQPADRAYAAMLQNMADRGKGKKYAVSGSNVAQELVAALKSIFSEINAVNSVFAASTLPVSVNVRGTNLNQLYIGVFRPDTGDQPRWLGNLKAYRLQSTSTGLVRSVDANTQPAIDDATGFIRAAATSFWTKSDVPTATYWSHLDPAAQGVGLSSDLPDGNLVEKGGAAQQVRGLYYTNGVNGTPTRPVYTCTSGALYTSHACVANELLSTTPFNTANLDITASALNITSRTVSSLSGAITKAITSIVDRRAVSLNNCFGCSDVSSISTNTVTLSPAVTAITNATTFTITAMTNGATSITLDTLEKSGTGPSAVSRGIEAAGHGLPSSSTGTIIVSGGSAAFNTSGASFTYISPTEFTYVLGSGNSSTNSNSATLTTSLATTTVTTSVNHGLGVGDRVTIAGASLTSTFTNGGTAVTITGVPAPNQFQYATNVSIAPGATGATATARSKTTNVASALGHPFSVGSIIDVSGATPSEYNGTQLVVTARTTNTFTYTTTSAATANSTVQPSVTYRGTTATVTTSSPHAFTTVSNVALLNVLPAGYGVSGNPTSAIPGTTTFVMTVPLALGAPVANPVIQATTGFTTAVTATLPNHGYVNGDRIDIRNVDDNNHNVTDVTVVVTDANTFTYTTGAATVITGNSGGPYVRATRQIANNIRAYATIASHGYGNAGTTFTVTTSGTGSSDYNRTSVTARVEDANTISYPLPHSAGSVTSTNGAVSTTGLAVTDSMTATAISAAHGFTNGEQVTISGATVAAFNGLKTITVPAGSTDTFTYTLGSAQGAAVGSPTIQAAGQSERSNVIDWIRGENNKGDDGIAVSTRPRPTIHGDVLHSRPAVVNYNRLGPCVATDTNCVNNIDNDVYIFYGGNDGLFRAVKGGLGSASGDPAVGTEIWAFAAPEQLGNLARLRQNSPPISSGYKKPYFFDGPIGIYTKDTNNDRKLFLDDSITPDPTSATQDKVWIYLTMRRGGRFIYAFDITQPKTPRLLWRKGCPSLETDASLKDANGCDLGFGELGQTWSEPKVVSINCIDTTKNCGATDPVLIFGGGYDEAVEDPNPSTVNCASATEVRTGGTMGDCTSGTQILRSMGRGIFVVNGRTGKLIFRASGQATPATVPTGATFQVVTDMDYAIPSDIAVVVGDPVAKPFRSYVGDTGGQIWRFDFGNVNPANWAVTKVASVADQATTTTYADPISGTNLTSLRGLRKFQFAPDLVGGTGFDMIVIGSGDREHPFDTTVLNRVYGIKDTAQTTTPPTLTTITHAATITYNGSAAVKALLDVTTQCIEIPGNCTTVVANHGGPEQAAGVAGLGTTPTASTNTSGALNASGNKGWFIELGTGEKQVGSTLASGSGVVQFGTNQPSTSAGGGATCSPNLGVARQYQINYLDGTAYNGTTLSTPFSGGGYLPSPVLVYVSLGGASGIGDATGSGVAVGGGITSGSAGLTIGAGDSTGGAGGGASAVVCYGAVCSIAPGSVLFSRVRKFWYKEID